MLQYIQYWAVKDSITEYKMNTEIAIASYMHV